MNGTTMSTEPSRYKDLGELHTLLLDACGPDENGVRSIPVLAKQLKISHQYIYRWIEMKRIPPKFARKLIERQGCPVKMEAFLPFF